PLPSGKNVTCPKCKAQFVIRDPDGDAKPAKPAKKSATPTSAAKKDPFDEEGPETYAVIKEEAPKETEEEPDEDEDEDEDEDRPKKKVQKDARLADLEFRMNTEVTDPRGPAQAALISPSNFLMLVGALACFVGIGAIGYGAWPFLFLDDVVDAAKVL